MTLTDASVQRFLATKQIALLATVRADETSLGNYDSSYTAASDRFGNRADAFTRSVRRLQRQLQQVTSVGHGG